MIEAHLAYLGDTDKITERREKVIKGRRKKKREGLQRKGESMSSESAERCCQVCYMFGESGFESIGEKFETKKAADHTGTAEKQGGSVLSFESFCTGLMRKIIVVRISA